MREVEVERRRVVLQRAKRCFSNGRALRFVVVPRLSSKRQGHAKNNKRARFSQAESIVSAVPTAAGGCALSQRDASVAFGSKQGREGSATRGKSFHRRRCRLLGLRVLLAGKKKGTPETLSPPSRYCLPRLKRDAEVLSVPPSTRWCDDNGDRSPERGARGSRGEFGRCRSLVSNDDGKTAGVGSSRRFASLSPPSPPLRFGSWPLVSLTLASSMSAFVILDERLRCLKRGRAKKRR